MKVYLVQASSHTHRYTLGAYKTKALAEQAARMEEVYRDGKYVCECQEFLIIDHPDAANDNDYNIDIQQQVEALQAYMDVMQNYVLTLKDAMMILLDMPDIRNAMGEKTTRVLRKDLAEGRRRTWDDEMRKYVKER